MAQVPRWLQKSCSRAPALKQLKSFYRLRNDNSSTVTLVKRACLPFLKDKNEDGKHTTHKQATTEGSLVKTLESPEIPLTFLKP